MNNKTRQQKGKTRDLFRKIGNIKQAFHPKMDTIMDKNGGDLVDTEEIKMEKLHGKTVQKKMVMNQIPMMVWLVT